MHEMCGNQNPGCKVYIFDFVVHREKVHRCKMIRSRLTPLHAQSKISDVWIFSRGELMLYWFLSYLCQTRRFRGNKNITRPRLVSFIKWKFLSLHVRIRNKSILHWLISYLCQHEDTHEAEAGWQIPTFYNVELEQQITINGTRLTLTAHSYSSKLCLK